MKKIFLFVCIIGLYTSSYAQGIDYDKKIGKEASEQIEKEMGIYNHNVLTPYIKNMGKQLTDSISDRVFDYNFEIVDMAMPNAFALPGGYVYVSRGLLSLVNSSDELAGVIGHEIGHCEKRHSVKQMRRKIIPAILKLPGEVVAYTVNEQVGQLINSPLNTGSGLFLAKYSRKHEKQADEFGVQAMAKAGYNPSYFPKILANLSLFVEQLTGEEEQFTYFDSHPYTPKRVEYLNKEVEKTSYTIKDQSESERIAFIKQLDGLCFGDNPAYGYFDNNTFMHPELKLHMTFPEGWATDKQPGVFGAVDTTDNKSMIVVGILPEKGNPEELGDAFVSKVKEKYKMVPEQAKTVNMNGIPAYLVSLKDNSGGQAVGIHSLWFNLNEVSYQLIGMAPFEQIEELKNAAKSIRPVTNQELQTIKVLTIRVKEAKAGESLDDFNKRINNVVDTNITAIMNELDRSINLTGGQLLKVVIEENYKE